MRTDIEPQQPDTPALLATPPRGLALVIWAALFLLLGSVGHDPWKGDDATHFGVIWSMLQSGSISVPTLTGSPHLEYPPLYHWLGMLLTQTLGWLLPAPDAARLASGVCAGLMLTAVGLAARRWHGAVALSPTVLLTLGSLGLMMHAHECQPMMAVAALAALGYLGFAWMDRHPLKGGVLAGLALGGLFLAGGLTATLLLAPLWLLAPAGLPGFRNRQSLIALGASGLLAMLVAAAFAAWVQLQQPDVFALWREAELQKLSPPLNRLTRLPDWAKMLAWFAWPAWPLAGWSLWQQRRHLAAPALRLPLAFLLCALVVAVLFYEVRSASALPLIVPFALLAAPGLPSLRRGAANAFDWFAVMTFGLLGLFVWFSWNTLANDYPVRFAATLQRLAPEFVFQFSLSALGVALTLSLCWTWLLLNSPRSPYRAITHWTAGVMLFWGLSATLIQPWVDFGKSYRPVVESLQHALRDVPSGCIASRNLGTTQRASLDYFANILTRHDSAAETQCPALLIQTPGVNSPVLPAPWQLRWEGRRPGDRNETLQLYVRP